MRSRLGNPQPFVPKGPALGERTQLGMAHGKTHGRTPQGRNGRPKCRSRAPSKDARSALDSRSPADNRPGYDRPCPGSSSPGPAGPPPAGRRNCQSALGGGDGLVMLAQVAETVRQEERDRPIRRGSSRTAARASASRKYARIRPRSPDEGRIAQGEPEIDSLPARIAVLRQMREGTERLLEIPHSLTVDRPRHGLLPRLSAVRQRLSPPPPASGGPGVRPARPPAPRRGSRASTIPA